VETIHVHQVKARTYKAKDYALKDKNFAVKVSAKAKDLACKDFLSVHQSVV